MEYCVKKNFGHNIDWQLGNGRSQQNIEIHHYIFKISYKKNQFLEQTLINIFSI